MRERNRFEAKGLRRNASYNVFDNCWSFLNLQAGANCSALCCWCCQCAMLLVRGAAKRRCAARKVVCKNNPLHAKQKLPKSRCWQPCQRQMRFRLRFLELHACASAAALTQHQSTSLTTDLISSKFHNNRIKRCTGAAYRSRHMVTLHARVRLQCCCALSITLHAPVLLQNATAHW